MANIVFTVRTAILGKRGPTNVGETLTESANFMDAAAHDALMSQVPQLEAIFTNWNDCGMA